ncbi:MAG: nucleotidyltransferase domain-containing protein [Chthonomonadetes bacterium]|nr:nucleotidyltransferase domain-containing protein [Chthonomonadetes bacterium]
MRFGLSREVIEQIHGVLARHPQVHEALIYGSRAKGNYKPGSDIDLVLCGDQSLNMDVLLRIMWELEELPLPYTFDVCIYHQIDDPELLDHIRRVGKPFYRRGQPPHEEQQAEA